MDNRIKDLMAQMTLQEKVALCSGETPWKTLKIDRLGLESLTVSDGPHGVRKAVDLDTMLSHDAGETKQVKMTLTDRAFSYYDPKYSGWLAEAGDFDILVGSSSTDIHLTQRVSLTQGTKLATTLNLLSTLGDWMEDPRGAEMVKPFLSAFGDLDDDTIGMDTTRFMNDLRLTMILSFADGQQDQSPD